MSIFVIPAASTRYFILKQHQIFIYLYVFTSFPTKAFRIWLKTSDLEHIFIAGSFFHYAGLFDPPSCDDISPSPPGHSDPLFVVKASKKAD